AILLATAGLSQAQQQYLLVPNGTGNTSAFDPFDGHHMSRDIFPGKGIGGDQLIDNGTELFDLRNDTFINRYSYNGTHLGAVVSATDPNVFLTGMALHNNQFYVSTLNGTSPSSIMRYDFDGSNATEWATVAGAPRTILFRDNDVVVGDFENDDILSYDFNGLYLSTLHNSNGSRGAIENPREIIELDNGNLLAGGGNGTNTLFLYDANGTELQAWDFASRITGLHQLGNGKIFAVGSGAWTVDLTDGSVESINLLPGGGGSFGNVTLSFAPTPGTGVVIASAGIFAARRRAR
ncbi:MAG: hypothetical protein ACIARQ_06605, partial [Phycisphaerales bacterium JB061]